MGDNDVFNILADTLTCCLVLGTAIKAFEGIHKNATGRALTTYDKVLLTTLPVMTGTVIWVIYFNDFVSRSTN